MVEIREREQLTEPKISITSEVRIISCQVVKDKLITQLDDGRKVIIAINLLTKWGVLDKEVKPEQLKSPELHSEGRYVYFPKIDDTLPVRALLADGREISIPTSWLTEQSVPLTKLQKYEI
ncbi:4204_t:CDS:2 [Racocetra persica]|uniref:4204_t:CDS:1 n=1 Tax=Racocetra persica TaxID=160502 RepID=A0ACA9PN50_9GLOM|nr:4204_t:CDS:2 [Racocetra persica]